MLLKFLLLAAPVNKRAVSRCHKSPVSPSPPSPMSQYQTIKYPSIIGWCVLFLNCALFFIFEDKLPGTCIISYVAVQTVLQPFADKKHHSSSSSTAVYCSV